jgi:hypothetical protein
MQSPCSPSFVIPAKAGTQLNKKLGSRFRGNDGLTA